ncbi:MAG: hypothetical protein NUW22_01485 [Acidobacteria bacterium]|nr:hypothetical protein [Acidobacteriota bacterium]
MEQQRPLRLGDLVDDYCPRERRVTNHAIVAIVEDTIRQTRCTTCESDHVYRGGKAPVRKKKDEKAVLYDQVLADVTSGHAAPSPPAPVVEAAVPAAPAVAPAPAPVVPLAAQPAASDAAPTPAPPVVDEGWSLNRPLIRASLPRNDSQPPTPRAIPEFTMHQRNVRGSHHFRGGGQGTGGFDRGQGANGNGNGGGYRGGFRADSQGQGPSQGPREQGQPGSPGGQRPGGGRRRRRHKKPKPQI